MQYRSWHQCRCISTGGAQLVNQGVYQAILPAGAKLVNSRNMEGAVRGFFRQGKVLTLMTQIKRASDFQTEILEDNNLRNEEIQRLQTLETTCMNLLNQANETISDLCSKEGVSFEKYENLMKEVWLMKHTEVNMDLPKQ